MRIILLGCIHDIMVRMVGNENNKSSNPRQGCLHFM